MLRRRGAATVAALIANGAGIACDPRGPAPRSPNPTPITGVVRVDTIARGLRSPWALEFLADGRMLVTERPGHLRIVDRDGRISEPLSGVPEAKKRCPGHVTGDVDLRSAGAS
jgi:glucose/arabinose dehydrogenase